MCLHNMNVKEGICNGTCFFFERFGLNVLFCLMIQNDSSVPEKRFMLPSMINNRQEKHYPFPFVRCQFPVRAVFAMTINKGQGATLDAVGLDLTAPVFGH
jgi:hypothetical protein